MKKTPRSATNNLRIEDTVTRLSKRGEKIIEIAFRDAYSYCFRNDEGFPGAGRPMKSR